MLTAEQINFAPMYHLGTCKMEVNGGTRHYFLTILTRNGKTRRYRNNAARFYVALKHGQDGHTFLNETCDLRLYHVPEECPLNNA